MKSRDRRVKKWGGVKSIGEEIKTSSPKRENEVYFFCQVSFSKII